MSAIKSGMPGRSAAWFAWNLPLMIPHVQSATGVATSASENNKKMDIHLPAYRSEKLCAE